jgi:predicted metalloprotease with PDZ domain
MLHAWIPGKMNLYFPSHPSWFWTAWYNEGLDDYLAKRLLRDEGLITQDRFVNMVDRAVINLHDDPYHEYRMEDLERASDTPGGNGQALNKHSYYRGFLIGLKWDAELAHKPQGRRLPDLVKAFFVLAKANDALISDSAFIALASSFGLDAASDIPRYVERGEDVALPPGMFLPAYVLADSLVPSFQQGYTVDHDASPKRINEVESNSAAHSAGLREGMEYVAVRNSNRFGNAWSPDLPLSVTIREDGSDRTISYRPEGVPMRLELYRPQR